VALGGGPRDSDTITFNAAAVQRVYGTITLTGTGAGGYQSGDGRCVLASCPRQIEGSHAPCRCSLRYFVVTQPSDLDVVNANLQLNNGKV
jgi:hypothetical protein